ncbi:AAA family ATPase [Sporosarcina sp. Marseille-Q4063]|uniref:DEAD/DEAH box helicase n=1 Tax=Sporosarcina sp. Marseille-Q4063 TaxID=2810514 RepID=UPI001BAEF158|nr:AAA domain-containing protein [Sporosarcina sp. Marseille-Q4063]QUW22441.1 AAA family ATPase [Sporosarcina sp. Marseille-Q4063]
MNQGLTLQTMQCNLGITNNARNRMMKFVKNEQSFFSMQEAFDIHIEKRPENRHGNMSFSIFFDNETNAALAEKIDNRVAVMECVYKNEGFLATGFHVRGRREPVRTNRRLPVRLKFLVNQRLGTPMPIELYTRLRELPIAEERSEYVRKRISSWEGYLAIQERNADVADITSVFSGASLNADFNRLQVICTGLKNNEWKAINNFTVRLKGIQNEIGSVVNTNRSKKIVEIELNRKYQELARKNEWQPWNFKEVIFSNFSELSQVKRLRKGFKDLQDGLAANANLEKVLFEERPVVRISKQQKDLVFHNQLNEFQQEAVTGAMTSNDLYVIQGPPGTGKTTVISEICHQNVKAGLRTLVASQANLAVDNALGRLLSHQDIRILRYGRTESIEEEGKKFIEENVALNWKQQTEKAVAEQLRMRSKFETELELELKHGHEQMQEYERELTSLEEQIRDREIAVAVHAAQSNELKKFNLEKEDLLTKNRELKKTRELLNKTIDELSKEISRIEEILTSYNETDQIEQMENIKRQITIYKDSISHHETLQKIEESTKTLADVQNDQNKQEIILHGLQTFLKDASSTTKLNELQDKLKAIGFIPSNSINQKIVELNQVIDSIRLSMSADTYQDWTELINRLDKAIETVGKRLTENGSLKQSQNTQGMSKPCSVKDIHNQIDKVGRFLIDPSVKQALQTRHYSAERYEYLEKLCVAFDVLSRRRNYAHSQIINVETSKRLFESIKIEVIEDVTQTISTMTLEIDEFEKRKSNHEIELTELQERSSQLISQLGTVDETISIEAMEEKLTELETTYTDIEKTKFNHQQYVQDMDHNQDTMDTEIRNLEKNTEELQLNIELTETISKKYVELEEQVLALKEVINQNPKEHYDLTLIAMAELSKEIERKQIEKDRLPITNALQEEWLTLLKDATEHDLNEIRKLYVQHANVIGTTCVASARRDFMEEYPVFDVVIIDEVSKATPPELLLPMLKGKKIILVGDHHQLPPLVGQETLEEFLEESEDRQEKIELKKLLEESLFERLFRTLPKQNKTMLGIQYRMHESIMETISPFYEDGDYRLQCGITDSNVERDHGIESSYVKRNDHLLWFDMPNEPIYFENKVAGGTSRYNQSELTMVKKLLVDLDKSVGKMKGDGYVDQQFKKSVGVISFYGEQVKRVDRLIQQELMPQHLHCRTGSVDKFQGMEMDIIILSFVRNHKDKSGDIGFARDYRRLNVALSRARELLIIVGSAEMFAVRTKDMKARKMYGRLVEEIKKKNGFRKHEEGAAVWKT